MPAVTNPFDDEHRMRGAHVHATWDGAYVLGALSYADRREFEEHLAGCRSCREAVTELSGMPALLSRLDREQVATIVADGEACKAAAPPPQLLPSLLAKVSWRRRRTRLVAWSSAAAAAAVLTIGGWVGVQGHFPAPVLTPPQASAPAPSRPGVPAVPMAQVGTADLASTVSVTGWRWGTFIDLECVCLAPADAPHDRLAMVVVGRDGSSTRLASWVAEPGHTATPAGSIATPVDQIAAVQVVSADNGKVLLQRSL